MPYSPSPHASENRARLWVTALRLCVSWALMRSPIFKPNLERLSHDMHSSDLYVSSVQQADNGPNPTAVADHKNIQRFIGLEAVCERCVRGRRIAPCRAGSLAPSGPIHGA